MPGIESWGAVSELPLMGQENDGVFQVEGKIYPNGPGPGLDRMSPSIIAWPAITLRPWASRCSRAVFYRRGMRRAPLRWW